MEKYKKNQNISKRNTISNFKYYKKKNQITCSSNNNKSRMQMNKNKEIKKFSKYNQNHFR